MPQNPHKPISPGDVFEQGPWVNKAVAAINNSIRRQGPRDQYSFEYSWIAKQCGYAGGYLPSQFLQKLVEVFTQAGWHAWLYEHGRDISGVAEDPAFVLDAPNRKR